MKRIILFLTLSSFSMVALGQSITLDPRSTQPAGVQVNADLAFRKIQRETTNGGWTAYNRQNASVIIFEGGGTLNSIADGQLGLVVYIFNGYPTGPTATGQLIIKHEESIAETVAANRIMTPTGTDYAVGNKGGVMLMYDWDKQRWRVLATDVAGGSFSGWGLTGNSGTTASNFIGTTDAQPLAFKTNNLERINIESGGDVGIGITSPDSKLHVAKASAGSVTAFSSSIATFESNTSGYISMLNPATNTGGILFGSPTGNAQGIVDYNHSTNKMGFATSNSYKMTIDGTGNVGIGTTSVATGVKFHLDNGASGVTPNSGGTFSPTLFMERNGHNYLEIASPDANERGIVFSNPTDGASGGIYYSSKNMYFRANTNNTRMAILANGNVGIGTTTPTAKLETNGTFAMSSREINNPSGGTGYILNTHSVYKLSGGGTFNITGIEAGADGQIIHLYALSSTNIVLQHNVSTLPAMRIITNTGSDLTIINGGGATLIYDADATYWRVIGFAQ